MKKEAEKSTITPRADDFSQWYQDVIAQADIAENSPVKGCMVIKPTGYAIWERIQRVMDEMLKSRGVENAYFPLLIPESFINREKSHIDGFSPELAVVTHGGGKKLAEPLVIRPTSETIIYDAFSRWIQSHRDLPYVVNQWANVVRWEMRPRVFLRSTEFLWQEGHTAHASKEEARQYALAIMNEVYKLMCEEFLAIPALYGRKSESEKFAGADETYTMEGLMQDGKSLQMGTSHLLGNNFAKSFNITFTDENGKLQYVEQTSWGVSTRLIGGIVMMHGDDKGIIVPPRIAPTQVVILPINPKNDPEVKKYAWSIKEKLQKQLRVKIDDRDERPGVKHFEWEKKGVPIRIEAGPKDMQQASCVMVRRDTGEKITVAFDDLLKSVNGQLESLHYALYERAHQTQQAMTRTADTFHDFELAVKQGGYVKAFWCGESACEKKIKDKTKATTRCLPFDAEHEVGGTCICCGKKSDGDQRWVFGISY